MMTMLLLTLKIKEDKPFRRKEESSVIPWPFLLIGEVETGTQDETDLVKVPATRKPVGESSFC